MRPRRRCDRHRHLWTTPAPKGAPVFATLIGRHHRILIVKLGRTAVHLATHL